MHVYLCTCVEKGWEANKSYHIDMSLRRKVELAK